MILKDKWQIKTELEYIKLYIDQISQTIDSKNIDYNLLSVSCQRIKQISEKILQLSEANENSGNLN